jgi:putative transposase
MSAAGRRAMLDHGHGQLSARRQCALLGLARSGVYRAKPEHDADELAKPKRRAEEFSPVFFAAFHRPAEYAGLGLV